MARMRFGAPLIPKRNLSAIPNTYDLKSHVETELARAVDESNARFNIALATNGTQIMFWRRTHEGHVCTCQSKNERLDDPLSPVPLSPQGSLPASTSIRVRGSRELADHYAHPQDKVLGVDIGVRDEDDQETPNFDDLDPSDLDDDNPNFLSQDALHNFLSGDSLTTCGICFGTGFTNGYSLYGGQRIVLESHNLSEFDGFSPSSEEDDDAPLTYFGHEGATLEWIVDVPVFFMNSWITARNNTQTTDVDILINGNRIPLDTLASFKGQRVTVSIVAKHDETKVTHAELLFQFLDWPYTQMENLQDDASLDSAETTQSFDFPLSPNISNVKARDVFFDFKNGKVWRINNVTESKTAAGQLMQWQVTAASRTQFDVLSLMRVNLFPKYNLSYRNLNL